MSLKIALISTTQKSGCPPIGLVYLASYIHKHTNDKVKIIDANYQDILKSDYSDYDLVGINAMTVNYRKATRLALEINHKNNKIPIIIGGVHISTNLDSQSLNVFESMVIGEGERSFIQLLKDFKENGYLEEIYETEQMNDLDDLTPPDWDLIDKRYFERQLNTTFAEYGIEGWLLTSRGCPFLCHFCSTTRFWKRVRSHSVYYIKNLIEDLKKRGVTHIQIWDDLFTIDKNRLRQLQPFLKNSGIKYNCQPRINKIDEETCQILKDSNITLCIFGFESGNDRVLKYLKNDESLSIKKSKQAIKLCRKYKLDVQGSLIFGSPTETLSEMIDTLKFMLWCYFNGVQRLWAFVATPFPATEFWKYTPKYVDYEELSHHTKHPLLLDKSVKLWQFKIVMFLAHRIEDLFKLKKLWKLIEGYSVTVENGGLYPSNLLLPLRKKFGEIENNRE